MLLNFSGEQALSRRYSREEHEWSIRSQPQNPLKFTVAFELVYEPFTFPIAALRGQRGSVGASEFVDEENTKYLSKRWPAKLTAKGTIDLPDEWLDDHRGLTIIRQLLWIGDGIPPDQRLHLLGYRREFQHVPNPDIVGTPRPVSHARYWPTDLGEPSSPGFVGFDERNLPTPSQFVWSEILEYPQRTDAGTDHDAIMKLVDAKLKHYNSHSELGDSEAYVDARDRKGAIMAAASAVEACLKHCIESKFLRMPKGYGALPFDEKIAKVLEVAELPPFTQLEVDHATNLLYLYRARNARHEGDCFYQDREDRRVDIKTIEQVKPLFASAQAFVFWMDTVV